MIPNLLELPLEVLLNITTFLDTPSYGNLRLACTSMEKNTFDAFATEFFTIKQFMVTSFSLQTLLDISQHSTLSKYLKKIIIGLEGLSIGRMRAPLPAVIDKGLRDQCHLLEVGSFPNALAAALRNLPNCHDIEIRDFASKTRFRDDGSWRSYGVQTWHDLGGSVHYHWTSPGQRALGRDIPSIIFNQVLTAIADSGMDCRYLGHVTRHDFNALQYLAFEITSWEAGKISRALSNVKSVMLAVKAAARSPEACTNLKTFLGYMTHLTKLRFNGNYVLSYDVSENMNSEINCLNDVSASVTQLELGKLGVDYGVLRQLIAAMATQGILEVLGLFRIGLNTGTWADIMDDLLQVPNLKSLTVKDLAQADTSSTIQRLNHIGFKKRPASSADDPSSLQVAARAMATFARSTAPDGSCTTKRVQSMSSALSSLKSSIVVRDKRWKKEHGLYGSQPSSSSELLSEDSDNDGSDSSSEDEF